MEIQSELELRQRLLQLLNGTLSLEKFEDWFVPHSWNFEENASPSLQSLVADIELLLAEYSNGHWTKEEIKGKLQPLVGTYRVSYMLDGSADPVITFSGSASPHFGSLQVVDIQFAVVSESPTHP